MKGRVCIFLSILSGFICIIGVLYNSWNMKWYGLIGAVIFTFIAIALDRPKIASSKIACSKCGKVLDKAKVKTEKRYGPGLLMWTCPGCGTEQPM